jgi:RHS repeat-associated protein
MFQAESGLHYNWFRQYDPTIGRYTQPDPLGLEAGISRYAYVTNNPLQQSDPRGLASQSLPLTGTPGIVANPNGHQWRVYDSNGLAICDIEFHDHMDYLHFHIYAIPGVGKSRGKPFQLIPDTE